jgi:hypothetical protein
MPLAHMLEIWVVRRLRPWPNLTPYRSPRCVLDLNSPPPLKGESPCEVSCRNLRDIPFLDGHSLLCIFFLPGRGAVSLLFVADCRFGNCCCILALSLRRATLSTDYTSDFRRSCVLYKAASSLVCSRDSIIKALRFLLHSTKENPQAISTTRRRPYHNHAHQQTLVACARRRCPVAHAPLLSAHAEG